MRLLLASCLLLFAPLLPAQDIASFDHLLLGALEPHEPGVAVLIARGDEVIYRAARGMANMEQEVGMAPEFVFRIGSITKQFTAVAALQLVEQGKVKLDDDITKHIPEYNAQGKRVTVEMLLNHTSGIKSYTDMKEFDRVVQRKDVKPGEIMAFFQDQPFDFEPGTGWRYNNSGYVLLGILIERVTGRSYAEFVDQEFFKPLGMKHSRYGSDEAIVPGRVSGYSPDGKGFQNAAYLSLSWPYAGGSLFSNVDDLHTWTRALYAGKLIKPETLKRAHTSAKLPNGKDTRYGHGWSIANVQGVPSVEHGGGINGFVTHALYLPQEALFVAVLTNRESNLAPDLCAKLAATAIGKPYTVIPIAVHARTLAALEGVYVDDSQGERYLRVVDGKLISQRKGGGTFTLVPFAKDRFAFEGSLTSMTFRRDRKGRVTGLTMHDRVFGDTEWTRTNKPLPEAPKEVAVTEQQLDGLLGDYELAPGFIMSITREGTQLFVQATGQPRFEAYAKSPLEFFLKVVDARIVFNPGADGRAESLVLHQGGQEMPGPRVK
ncbi:MAG: serine hydrolase [Flavobacteriales bacterium]|nr:serine hydrolase [Flavobacteriales bacterium]